MVLYDTVVIRGDYREYNIEYSTSLMRDESRGTGNIFLNFDVHKAVD